MTTILLAAVAALAVLRLGYQIGYDRAREDSDSDPDEPDEDV